MEGILTGVLGGAGAIFVWEVFLKPKRDRRNVAEMLSAEVSLDMQLLAGAEVKANPKKVPPDFRLSMVVFNAVVEKIGELPSRDVGEVVLLYAFFEQLNELPRTYSSYLESLRNTPPDAPHRAQVEREVQTCVDVFNQYVRSAIDRVNIIQPRLLKTAFPWWSWRRWRREPSKSLRLEDVAARGKLADSERARTAAEIAKRRSQS